MTQLSSNIAIDAEKLANIMHEMAQWSKGHPNARRYASKPSGLIKLPPVFQGDGKSGDGKQNLVAMIRTMSDYEEGVPDGTYPTLAELPARYNKYGGLPELSGRETRKVHNWMRQVSFGLRAAIMEIEERSPSPGMEKLSVPERVMRRLYAGDYSRRAFITYAADNRYEFKPLRYASPEAIRRWLAQEYMQKRTWNGNGVYGAQPTSQEWDMYGLRGQTKTICAVVEAQIAALRDAAHKLDADHRYIEADETDARLQLMSHNLDYLKELGMVIS